MTFPDMEKIPGEATVLHFANVGVACKPCALILATQKQIRSSQG